MKSPKPPPPGPTSADEPGLGAAVAAATAPAAPGGASAEITGAFAGLGPRQCQAMEALLQGQTMSRAALIAGVHERTLRKWMRKDRFRQTLLAARREAFGQAIGLTARYAPAAVGALVKVINDQHASANARVAAAAVLLKFGREGIELDDLSERVAQLEALIEASSASAPTQRLAPEDAAMDGEVP